jgi:hypothetical protein
LVLTTTAAEGRRNEPSFMKRHGQEVWMVRLYVVDGCEYRRVAYTYECEKVTHFDINSASEDASLSIKRTVCPQVAYLRLTVQ